MHVPPGLLRRRLGFWISQGVLKEESSETYVVVEKQKGQQKIPGMLISQTRKTVCFLHFARQLHYQAQLQ